MRCIAFAYACEPQHGSEPGAGWMWARILSTFGDTWVITRANNRLSIESGLRGLRPGERDTLHFVYVDLPPWATGWKRGRRGIHLYYLLWLLAAYRCASRLRNENDIDLVWHLTFSNIWLGTIAPLLGLPCVYGPVGGAAVTPPRLLPVLGVRGVVADLVRDGAIVAGRYFNPLARLAWRRSALVLVQNPETRRWLPKRYRVRAEVFPNVVIGEQRSPTRVERTERRPRALYVGNLVPLKGVPLAIRALLHLPGWELLVLGSGPQEKRLRRLSRRLGVDGRVRFLGAVPREKALQIMAEEADVLLFPSLHDQAGWAVVEALSCGLPVVCVDRGGPPVLGGHAVPPGSPAGTAAALAEAVRAQAGRTPDHPRDYCFAAVKARLSLLLSERGLMSREAEPLRPTGVA